MAEGKSADSAASASPARLTEAEVINAAQAMVDLPDRGTDVSADVFKLCQSLLQWFLEDHDRDRVPSGGGSGGGEGGEYDCNEAEDDACGEDSISRGATTPYESLQQYQRIARLIQSRWRGRKARRAFSSKLMDLVDSDIIIPQKRVGRRRSRAGRLTTGAANAATSTSTATVAADHTAHEAEHGGGGGRPATGAAAADAEGKS
jgi:hypothetical protein